MHTESIREIYKCENCEDCMPCCCSHPKTSQICARCNKLNIKGKNHRCFHTSWRCQCCKLRFSLREQLREHTFNLLEAYYCPLCKEYIMKDNHKCSSEERICAFCGKNLTDRSQIFISNHLCFHNRTLMDFDSLSKEGFIRCSDCSSFVASGKFERHSRNHRAIFGTPMTSFECRICKKVLGKRFLKTHWRRKHPSEPISCSTCGEQFLTFEELFGHKDLKHPENMTPCFICGKVMEKHKVIGHLHSVHKTALLKCPKCDKCFRNNHTLKRHGLSHSNVHDYKCSICGKEFKRSEGLRVHKLSHADVKPFTCSFCPKTFTTKQWRDKHQIGCRIKNC
ncbi:hypothetical protein JTB14_006870 [Gonioctena quinquepunctata]|nr:hypothetical protein JTB14_006870 [Gonioctena quinquepunctata]